MQAPQIAAVQQRAAAAARLTAHDRPGKTAPRAVPWRDLGLLALLLLAAAGLRAYLIRHTEVAARDSIGYIRYAWQLNREPWADVLRKPEQQQHPGYPMTVLAAFRLVRPLHPGPDVLAWQLSAQLATAVAGTLLVIPIYLLGRALFDRGIGFWSALLFQCLPSAGRVLADGLSEGAFLLCAACALLAAVQGLKKHSVLGCTLAGLFGVLAYLVRPEGAVIVAATGVVLMAGQARAAWRMPWRRCLACGTGLALAALAAAAPFVAITGKITAKHSPNLLLKGETAQAPDLRTVDGRDRPPPPDLIVKPPQATGGGPVLASIPPPAMWWTDGDGDRRLWGLRALGWEMARGTQYVLWIPMLLGLWWFRDRFSTQPGVWVMLLSGAVIAALLWVVATRLGYLSDRHLLLVILLGIFWAAAALAELPRRLAGLLGRLSKPARSPLWGTLLLLAIIAAVLPRTLEPLHANRKGFRHAGLWLAERVQPWDSVLDPYCWSHFYAGKVFHEGANAQPPEGVTPVDYVVVEIAGNEHARLPLMKEAGERSRQGEVVFRWTGRRRKEVVDVVVFAVPQVGRSQ